MPTACRTLWCGRYAFPSASARPAGFRRPDGFGRVRWLRLDDCGDALEKVDAARLGYEAPCRGSRAFGYVPLGYVVDARSLASRGGFLASCRLFFLSSPSALSAFPGVRLFEDAEPMGFSRPIGAGWLSFHRSGEDVYRLQMADASAIVALLHSLYAAGLPAGEGVCPPVATGRGFLGCPTSPHKQAGE